MFTSLIILKSTMLDSIGSSSCFNLKDWKFYWKTNSIELFYLRRSHKPFVHCNHKEKTNSGYLFSFNKRLWQEEIFIYFPHMIKIHKFQGNKEWPPSKLIYYIVYSGCHLIYLKVELQPSLLRQICLFQQ